MLRTEEHLGPALGSLEAMELARWDDLPDAALPWEEIEEAARRQGISEADVIWDLAGSKKASSADRLAVVWPGSGRGWLALPLRSWPRPHSPRTRLYLR